jgi:hypothetical protein
MVTLMCEHLTTLKEMTVIRLTPLFLTALLAGCGGPLVNPLMPVTETAPEAPAPLPPEVAAFVPAGTPSTVVFQDPNGCYLYSIEVTDPPSGFPLRDGAGRQICPGQTTTPLPPNPTPGG